MTAGDMDESMIPSRTASDSAESSATAVKLSKFDKPHSSTQTPKAAKVSATNEVSQASQAST
ncbi:hypothetical protein BGX34_005640, partial [Mortierella sp. NVP85]